MLLSDGSEYRIGYRHLADKSSRKLPCRKTFFYDVSGRAVFVLCSRNISVHLSEIQRSCACDFTEHGDKVAGIGKSGSAGNTGSSYPVWKAEAHVRG